MKVAACLVVVLDVHQHPPTVLRTEIRRKSASAMNYGLHREVYADLVQCYGHTFQDAKDNVFREMRYNTNLLWAQSFLKKEQSLEEHEGDPAMPPASRTGGVGC